MDDTVYGCLVISVDNMTRIETSRPVTVHHYHPRLRQMANSYCREKFKVTPPIETGKGASPFNEHFPFYESITFVLKFIFDRLLKICFRKLYSYLPQSFFQYCDLMCVKIKKNIYKKPMK